MCIEFDKSVLLPFLDGHSEITYGLVQYRTIESLKSAGIEDDELPFIKRQPYKDEQEFRIIYVDMQNVREFAAVKISLHSIRRITLSPWMPKPLAEAAKRSLKSIDGCQKLRVYRSTLIENERWKRVVNPKLKEA